MKKVLKILMITLGAILLLLILVPVLFKSKIETMVKEKVNAEVHATVDWSRLSLSFFRGFPDLSINLHQVSVVGLEYFEGDTLVALERFELRVNPFGALKKNLEVKSVLLDRPLMNLVVLEDGSANWDITSSDEEVVTDQGGGSSMSVSLKRLAISDGRIYYADRQGSLDASLEGFRLELKGDFSMEETELQLTAGIDLINARMGGIRYVKDGNFGLDLVAAANMVENSYILKKNLISFNGLTLGAEGEVSLLDEGAMEMDLRIFSTETSFHTLLSLVPAIYLKDFESLKTSGNLQLEGTVKGIMKDSIMPDASLDLKVSDGYFAYPDLPKEVSDIQLALHVDYRGSEMDATTINLERFHFLLGGNPFELNMKVDHPISDMHVAGKARGLIDFAALEDVVPMEDVSLKGRLETDLRWDTRMSYIEQELFDQVDLEGRLVIEDVVLESPDIPVPVELTKMHMDFTPRVVKLLTLDLLLGSSDFHMDGTLSNFIPYVFNNQVVSGSVKLRSQLLNANELLPEREMDLSEEEQIAMDTLLPVPPDSLAAPSLVRIPENIGFDMSLDMKRVEYNRVLLENIRGQVKITEGVAILENMSMDVIEGEVITNGWVDTRGEFMAMDVALEMTGVDIASSYSTFVSVERLAPMARFCKGTANVNMKYASKLDASFTPLYESINARGQMYTKGLRFYNLDDFVRFSDMLKNEKFQELAPDEVYVGFAVEDGRIIFDPFDMKVYDSKMTVSGSHGMDHSLSYTMDMNIAKSDLGAGANDMMKGISVLAAGAGIRIPESDYIKVLATLSGTFNDPKVRTDLSANLRSTGETVKAAVQERVVEEVEKVEEQVREEASAGAEQIISDAEAQAARLVEEARKAGDELVQEAEKQGENLIEEAGSSVLKQIAAKKAAEELKKQAVKQSENLVREAEVQAAEIIQKARDEAARI